jgi:hypothetical protein
MLDVLFTLQTTHISSLDRVASSPRYCRWEFEFFLSLVFVISSFYVSFFLRKPHKRRSMLGPIFWMVTKAFQMILSLTACPSPSGHLKHAMHSSELSDFIVWRHTWRKPWVNCSVLTGNSAGLRTVLSSRLSHRELRSSLRESHSFLSLPADTTMTSPQGTSVSSNSFSR